MDAIQELERKIARQCIRDLLTAGYTISVYDGEETPLEQSTAPRAILAAMFSTDEDYLLVHRKGEPKHMGWVRFIYGNSGWDVINDYTTNLETTIAKTNALADKYDR